MYVLRFWTYTYNIVGALPFGPFFFFFFDTLPCADLPQIHFGHPGSTATPHMTHGINSWHCSPPTFSRSIPLGAISHSLSCQVCGYLAAQCHCTPTTPVPPSAPQPVMSSKIDVPTLSGELDAASVNAWLNLCKDSFDAFTILNPTRILNNSAKILLASIKMESSVAALW